MIKIDDSQFTPEHEAFIQEWAHAFVLLSRVVLAAFEGDLYVEELPENSLPRE